jgi:hypothetical protein
MRQCIFYSSIIFILAVLASCKKTTQERENWVSVNQITDEYDSLTHDVMTKGDTNAYDELFYGFIDSNKAERTDSVLRYSRIMAVNFKYERAYYDYLKALCEKNKIENNWNTLSELDLTKRDANSRATTIDWLNQMLQDGIITQEEFNSVKK